MIEPWMHMPCMFLKGANGIVIPEIQKGCEWVYNTDSGLMTMKMDGILVRLELSGGVWFMDKHIELDQWEPMTRDSDPILFECFDNLNAPSVGMFECYGKDIKGNPHGLDVNLMIKVFPVDYALIVNRIGCGIPRGFGTKVEPFYDAIKRELIASPEIEGLVFHLEAPSSMKLSAGATITKKDFGLPWPDKTADTPR